MSSDKQIPPLFYDSTVRLPLKTIFNYLYNFLYGYTISMGATCAIMVMIEIYFFQGIVTELINLY